MTANIDTLIERIQDEKERLVTDLSSFERIEKNYSNVMEGGIQYEGPAGRFKVTVEGGRETVSENIKELKHQIKITQARLDLISRVQQNIADTKSYSDTELRIATTNYEKHRTEDGSIQRDNGYFCDEMWDPRDHRKYSQTHPCDFFSTLNDYIKNFDDPIIQGAIEAGNEVFQEFSFGNKPSDMTYIRRIIQRQMGHDEYLSFMTGNKEVLNDEIRSGCGCQGDAKSTLKPFFVKTNPEAIIELCMYKK